METNNKRNRYTVAEHIENAVVRKYYETVNPNKTYASRSSAIRAARDFAQYISEQYAAQRLSLLEAKAKAAKKSAQIAKASGMTLEQVMSCMYGQTYNHSIENPLTIKYGHANELTAILDHSRREYGHRYATNYYRYELTIRKGWRMVYVHGVLTFIPKTANIRKGCAAEWLQGNRQHVRTVKGWLVRDYHSDKGSLEAAIQDERERRTRLVMEHRTRSYTIANLRTKFGDLLLTWADSIKSGNCEAGTLAFCERFGFTPSLSYSVREVIDRVQDKHCIGEYSATLKRAILAAVLSTNKRS